LYNYANKSTLYNFFKIRADVGNSSNYKYTNLDDCTQMGCYSVAPVKCGSNDPRTSYGYDYMLVFYTYSAQFLISVNSKRIYTRQRQGNPAIWSNWYYITETAT
jgi:hypothetical protein